MASLMESYEQQYSSLTADIVSKTGSIPNLAGCMYIIIMTDCFHVFYCALSLFILTCLQLFIER